MTIFQQAILKGALYPAHLAAGMFLAEDDHTITLKQTDNEGNVHELAHWGIYANIRDIQRTATKLLEGKQDAQG